MSKVGNSYDSVVFGVSEQVAHDRRSGQMEEQINLISDPVNGLSRRRGSVYRDEMTAVTASLASLASDLSKMKEFSFTIDGTEYTLLYRASTSVHTDATFAFLYNKSTDQFMPIVYENSPWVDDLVEGGVSAITAVGRYVYIAGNDNVPVITITNDWDTVANLQKMVGWVRGGAYSRTFSLTLTKTDDTKLTVSYTTLPSSYQGVLDTSDILFSDPEYQKKVNDRVNAYNGAVTAYIGEAAQDITPENIAQELVDALVLAGVTASRIDGTVVIDDPDYKEISGDDGGDNTLIRAVGGEVPSPTLMSTTHYPGKIVRIRPQGSSDSESYYLVAYAKDGVTTDWTEVIWREGAGVSQVPDNIFSQAIIESGTMYVAQNGIGLTALAPTSGDHPEFKQSSVGDPQSSPTPAYYGNRITMLATFQDRLLVGSNNIVNASRNGDYLNFFRHTVLNIQDNDSIEMFAFGSEGDVLRAAVMYDKDLIMFGDKKQYGLTGRVVLSAKTPNITLLSAHEDANSAYPVASGNFVFYGKYATTPDGNRTSLHQLMIGPALTETPVSHDVSSALDEYIVGVPCQIVAVTRPNLIVFRTEEQSNMLYTYAYLDREGGGERLWEAWNKWRYDDTLGLVCGLSQYKGSVLVFTARDVDGDVTIVADKQSLNTKLGPLPYIDSQRTQTDVLANATQWHAATNPEVLSAAIDNTSDYFLLGTNYDELDDLLDQLEAVSNSAIWVGVVSEGYVTPTNPYIRDSKGKAVLSGRLTLNKVTLSVTETSGLYGEVTTSNGTINPLQYKGRILGAATNLIGRQPSPTTQLDLGIGREVRECSYTLRTRQWLPLTITAIEWQGQFFNRVRRS